MSFAGAEKVGHAFRTIADPLLLATKLVEEFVARSPDSPYVVYERDGEYAVALGAVAGLSLDRHRVVLRTGTTREEQPVGPAPMDSVARLLGGRRRVYGWAAFELAHLIAGAADRAGERSLLELIEPRYEVRLSEQRAVVEPADVPDWMIDVLTDAVNEPDHQAMPLVDLSVGAGQYSDSVDAAVRRIEARELQKVILSRVIPVAHPVDLPATYIVGRRANTPARSFLLDLGGIRATGFSPEVVAVVDQSGRVTTQPLAGTRALHGDDLLDHQLRADLQADPKEIFEHAISVKAAVDELSDVCAPGTIHVDDYMSVKQRGSVQHLASSASGQLAPGVTCWQAFSTLFPAITSSGVPKLPAYRVISDLEESERGLYSGAVLWADADGTMDAALVLRTLFQRDGQTWLRAGAGVVAQSSPHRELEETEEKLRSIAEHLVSTT